MVSSRKAIMEMLEKLQKDRRLQFTMPATFGGGVAVVQLNPNAGKRYILQVAKDLETALASPPYWTHDKSKPIAKWVADRLGTLVS